MLASTHALHTLFLPVSLLEYAISHHLFKGAGVFVVVWLLWWSYHPPNRTAYGFLVHWSSRHLTLTWIWFFSSVKTKQHNRQGFRLLPRTLRGTGCKACFQAALISRWCVTPLLVYDRLSGHRRAVSERYEGKLSRY